MGLARIHLLLLFIAVQWQQGPGEAKFETSSSPLSPSGSDRPCILGSWRGAGGWSLTPAANQEAKPLGGIKRLIKHQKIPQVVSALVLSAASLVSKANETDEVHIP